MLSIKAFVLTCTAIGAWSIVCPRCDSVVSHAATQNSAFASQTADSATLRLHISGMTCSTCPVTARVAIKKLAGVYAATVTLEDSMGLVRYDARRLTPAQIVSHLAKLTGYQATVLDSAQGNRRAKGR